MEGQHRAGDLLKRLPARRLQTWAGTVEPAIPKPRQGSDTGSWLLECAAARSGALGHRGRDLRTRRGQYARMEKLVESLGATTLSKRRSA